MNKSETSETLIDLLENSAEQFPLHPALTMNINFRTHTLTYSELLKTAKRTAVWLQSKGIEPGDRVLINTPNSPYVVATMWGIFLRGATIVPLNTQSTPEMVRGITNSCEAKLLLTSARAHHDPELNIPFETIDFLPELLEGISETEFVETPVESTTVAQIMYTSGTTGDPKGVVLTHESMLTTAEAVAKRVRVGTNDRMLSLLPLSHIYEQIAGLLAPMKCGSHIIYLHRPSALIPLLCEYRITVIVAVPEFLRVVMSKVEQEIKRKGLTGFLNTILSINKLVPFYSLRRIIAHPIHKKLGGHLRIVASGGSPLDPTLEQKWNSLGVKLLQGYGLTEVSGVATMNEPGAHKIHSVGRPISNIELKIAEDGEICIRGKSVMREYLNKEEETREAIDSEQWFHTGDIGLLDKDNFLFIKGRKKYMLKGAGGQNVYPEDIETELDKDPAVIDSCVVSVEENGHMRIVAVVRLESSSKDPLADIQNRVNANLASYQTINTILVWQDNDFPRSASRKIKRNPVQDWVSATITGENTESTQASGSHLARIVADVAGVSSSKVLPETNIVTELGLDSLMRVELVSRIELELGTLIDEVKITPNTTLSDLEKLITEAEPVAARPPFVRWPLSPWAKVTRKLLQPIAFGMFRALFRVHGIHTERLDNVTGPCLFMPNHQAVIDSVAIARTLPRHLKKNLSHAAGSDIHLFTTYGYLAWIPRLLMNIFALPRKEGTRISDGLAYVGWMLDRKQSVMIFPEGTSKEGEDFLEIKDGVALLAQQMQVPVIPVYVTGMRLVMRPHTFELLRLGKDVAVRFGDPIYFKQNTNLEEVRMQIALALGALRQESENEKNEDTRSGKT